MNTKIMNQAKQLSEEHWSYIASLLKAVGIPEELIEKYGFMYRTSMVHGYKHGFEESTNNKE